MKSLKKMKIVMLIAVSLIFAGCGSVNIGYVDGDRVMTESPQIQNVIEDTSKKIEEAQKEVETALNDNQDMTDEERQKLQDDFQRKVLGLNQAYNTQLKYKFDEALAKITQEKNIDVVVDSSKNQQIIAEGGVDLTDDVIKNLQ